MIPDSFYEEEMREGYLVTREQKQLWAVQLDLLEYFIKFCDSHHLTYYIDSGSLLGAVRHKGYIPWDDDIDVAMFREDYNRFQRMAMRYFEEPYFCQTIYNDPQRLFPHVQIRNSATNLENKDGLDYNHGIYIDVFPLDGMPDDMQERNAHITAMQLHWLLIKKVTFPWFDLGDMKELVGHLYNKYKDIPPSELYKQFEQIAAQYSGKDSGVTWYDCVWFRMMRFPFPVKKEWYRESIELPFEHLTVRAPKEYDKVLKVYYGEDYMTPKQLSSFHDGGGILDGKEENS